MRTCAFESCPRALLYNHKLSAVLNDVLTGNKRQFGGMSFGTSLFLRKLSQINIQIDGYFDVWHVQARSQAFQAVCNFICHVVNFCTVNKYFFALKLRLSPKASLLERFGVSKGSTFLLLHVSIKHCTCLQVA